MTPAVEPRHAGDGRRASASSWSSASIRPGLCGRAGGSRTPGVCCPGCSLGPVWAALGGTDSSHPAGESTDNGLSIIRLPITTTTYKRRLSQASVVTHTSQPLFYSFMRYSKPDGCFFFAYLPLPAPFRGYIFRRCSANHSEVIKGRVLCIRLFISRRRTPAGPCSVSGVQQRSFFVAVEGKVRRQVSRVTAAGFLRAVGSR